MMTVKVGDKIRITNAYLAFGAYKDGDILTVSSVTSGDKVYVEEHGTIITRDEFEVLPEQLVTDSKLTELEARLATAEGRIAALEEAVPSAETTPIYRKVTGRSPQVGDYVKYDEVPHDGIIVGKHYEIIEIDSYGDPQFIDEVGDKYDTDGDDYEVYEKVSAEQADSQPQEAAEQSLKVGDYAKVIGNGDEGPAEPHHFAEGTLVEIIREAKSATNGPARICKEISGDEKYSVATADLIPATDEEVAEARRAAKFAEIGRVVGEFKAGDIVRFTGGDDLIYHGLRGHEGVVTEVEIGGMGRADLEVPKHIKSNGFGTGTLGRWMELITPVERRFDR